MAKTKHVWELSKRKILKLRKEITLNSMFVRDYQNSFGLYPHEVQTYFDGYVENLWKMMPKHWPEKEKLARYTEYDTKENLLFYHETYDRL